MKYFHAHIYFKAKDIDYARSLANKVRSQDNFEKVEFYEKPIGPHPLGMIEAHFREPCRKTITEWLTQNHGKFSVLIHEDTGDDVKDHTDDIVWLGEELKIDFSFFELIKTHPELRVHP